MRRNSGRTRHFKPRQPGRVKGLACEVLLTFLCASMLALAPLPLFGKPLATEGLSVLDSLSSRFTARMEFPLSPAHSLDAIPCSYESPSVRILLALPPGAEPEVVLETEACARRVPLECGAGLREKPLPGAPVRVISRAKVRDVEIALVEISPMVRDAEDSEVRLLDSVKFTVQFRGANLQANAGRAERSAGRSR